VAGGPAGADGKTVIDKMRAGDKLANEAFDEYIRSFGKAICPLLHIVDPDAIVLGGGLSNVDEIYERLPQAVLPNIFNDEFKTPVVKNKWGDSGGVRGAALLWSLDDIQALES
jgi:fructokinase